MTALACNFGVKTRSGHGGFPTAAAASSAVTGTNAADWAINDLGELVPSGTYGAVTTFAASSYALTLANGDTVAVTMLANAAHARGVNSGANADQFSPTNVHQLYQLLLTNLGASGAMLRGDTIWCRTSVFNPTSQGARIRLPLNGYGGTVGGWITIQAEVATLASTGVGAGFEITRVTLDNVLQTGALYPADIKFKNILFRNVLPDQTGATNTQAAAARTVGALGFAGTKGRHSRVAIEDCRACGTVVNDTNGLLNASGFTGVCDQFTMLRVLSHDLYNPYLLTGDDMVLDQVHAVRASNDGFKISAPNNFTMRDCSDLDKRYPVGVGAHPDHFQLSCTTLPVGTNQGLTQQRCIFINGRPASATGEDGQASFVDDMVTNSYYTGALVENILSMCQLGNGISHNNTHDSIYRRLTVLREETAASKVSIRMSGGVNLAVSDSVCDAISLIESYKGNAASGCTSTRVIEFDPGASAIGVPAVKVKHAAAMVAPAYSDGNQSFDPNAIPTMAGIATARAALMAKFAPKVLDVASGGFRNPDGTYAGALFPNGTWNDGTVYGASVTPPTSVTLSLSSSSSPIGVAVNVLATLDQPATAAVVVTLAKTVTGTFGSPTITIGIGSTAGSTTFTGTAVSTGTISGTNGSSLTGPSAVALAITSAAPTVASRAYLRRFNVRLV